MKLVLAIMCGMVLSTTAFAQTKKMSPPPQPMRTAAPTTLPVYTPPSYNQNEITGTVGMVAGALNFGATYTKLTSDLGLGGYLFYQAGKDKNGGPVVNQMTAFGILSKITIFDSMRFRAYLAPGFGMAMVKDVSISATGTKSDENIIGPTFKIGAQFKTSGNLKVGVERMLFSNWTNDSLNLYNGPAEFTSASFSFDF